MPNVFAKVLGLDVGGAHLKAADLHGRGRHLSFPLWKHPDRLAAELTNLFDSFDFERLALTMTGELCDCFRTKSEGVTHIVRAAQEALAATTNPNRPILVWLTDGRFVPPEVAIANPWLAAASNWMALAQFAASLVPAENALLVDVGSTTSDLIPIRDGRVVAVGRSDPERLASGELVYLGVSRTPLCATLRTTEIRGVEYRVAAELFAMSGDAYRVLGLVPEEPNSNDTADGAPATKECSHRRLARVICSDESRFTWDDAHEMAEEVYQSQLTDLRVAAEAVLRRSLDGRVTSLIISGEGEFLVRQLADEFPPLRHAEVRSLAKELSPELSDAACAYAVAKLLEAITA